MYNKIEVYLITYLIAMTTLHLSNNFMVKITTYIKSDNIIFCFQWNKLAHSLPFPEDIRDSMEEVVIHKNYLTIYLAKVIHLSKPNREQILSKLQINCTMKNDNLEKVCGPTPPENYRAYLQKGCALVSNKRRDIHLALIETIWNLWI